MKHILLIDDCEDFRQSAAQVIEQAGYVTTAVSSPEEAFQFLRVDTVDLVICDLHMPFTLGPETKNFIASCEVGYRTVKELAWALPNTPVVVLSSLPQIDLIRFAKFLDPIRAFSKPARAETLVQIVNTALAGEQVQYLQ